MKNGLILMLTGALIGAVVASFIVPPMLSWYTSPGGLPNGAQVQAVVEVPQVVAYVTSRLLWGQGIGAVIGAILGLAISVMMRRPRPAAAVPAKP